jgi:hypothetical protein
MTDLQKDVRRGEQLEVRYLLDPAVGRLNALQRWRLDAFRVGRLRLFGHVGDGFGRARKELVGLCRHVLVYAVVVVKNQEHEIHEGDEGRRQKVEDWTSAQSEN